MPGSSPCPDIRLATRGAWGGANTAMTALFRTTEFHLMKKTSNSSTTTVKTAKTNKASAPGKKSTRGKCAKPSATADGKSSPRVKPTKIEQCLALLSTPHGATIDELKTATGWQAHSVRGFLAGTVKKKLGLGLGLDSQKADDGVRRYRVVQAGA